jgi:ABC-type multidrug transport system fused ATPase/permease subunit
MIRLYTRVLELLGKERRLGWILAGANLLLAGAQFAEPVLFGRIIDVLSGNLSTAAMQTDSASPWPLLAAWVAFGLFTIVCGAVVALHADRLAHRQRQAVLTDYFEHIMQLPLTFHTGTHSGRLMKVMLAGTDALWRVWLGFFREHFASIVSLFVLLPLSIYLNWRLAILLVILCVVFTVLTTMVVRKTSGMQSDVEEHYGDLSARASDALGNVALVQSFTRIDAEVQGLRGVSSQLLEKQMPVLSWWALVSVMTRASTTITVLAIFTVGIALHQQGLTTVGEIVMFVSFATMLIQKLEQVVSFINTIFMEAPRLRDFMNVLDAVPAVRDRIDAMDPGRLQGMVEFNDVSFSYDGKRPAIADLSFTALPGETIALVGATGAGKSTAIALLHRPSTRNPASSRSTVWMSVHSPCRACAETSASCSRRRCCSTAPSPTTCASASRMRRTKSCALPPPAPRRSISSNAAITVSTPMPASVAACCPAASGNGCRSPVHC